MVELSGKKKTTIYINGKFTAQRITGVQRVAKCLVAALDEHLSRASTDSGERWVLLYPPGGVAPALQHIEARQTGRSRQPLHQWEQVDLPLTARKGVLVSLSGSAPFFAQRQVVLMHDAAVFDYPGAYTKAFVGWYRLLFRQLARGSAKLLTVSTFSRERLATALAIEPSRISVIPIGCDHLEDVVPDFTVLSQNGLEKTPFLLAVGSANLTKNLPALMSAFDRLSVDGSLLLVIVGGRNDRVFSVDCHAALTPNVVRTGPVSDAALKVLYQHAVALVFPSLYEGFGLPPLEAMACGCVVAASKAASIPEVCGDAASYFDPGSIDSMVSALQGLLADAALGERLRQAGTARASRHRWSESAKALLAHVTLVS